MPLVDDKETMDPPDPCAIICLATAIDKNIA
ncbi:unannotated protein [freshwater metagenome]|uniref:Unannotated protein n=1 Tax=freshwater metagenome TaxID=449393 RepID=A0A6J7AL85_9ZZZZ